MLRRIAAEGIGSLLLAATVIGSGIMAERLAAGNLAVALIANTGATVAVLATLIALLGPVSGAHFNPAVSLVQAFRGALPWRDTAAYTLVQILGCCVGAVLAHAMFSLPLGWSPPGSERLTGSPHQPRSQIRPSPSPVLCLTRSRVSPRPMFRRSSWLSYSAPLLRFPSPDCSSPVLDPTARPVCRK
jgi:glycerol uptake facilitator-like aquaporin